MLQITLEKLHFKPNKDENHVSHNSLGAYYTPRSLTVSILI